jgi:colicin import membrane protein
VASLGSPPASAAKMSPSLWDQLDGLLQEQYKRCWNFAGLGGQQKYVPEIHVQYTQDGSLIGQPVLLNPPSDPNLRALAESAMRAVRRCDPLRIPSQYQLYYDQWKGRIVRFDPEEML